MNRNSNSVAAVLGSARVLACNAGPARTFGVSPRPTLTAFALFVAALCSSDAFAEKISLVGGTVINPADSRTIENAVVVIDGNKIESVASRKESGVPVGSKWVECDKKFILPGYVDTHVHFFSASFS